MGRQAERGQGSVEWVGVLGVVALAFAVALAVGVRVPGGEVARAVASRILCAAALADRCGDEPTLIAAYGDEVARLARLHLPLLLFERGSKALPVDFRRCRSTACADGTPRGLVRRSDAGLPVTAFVHVVDCRETGDPPGLGPGTHRGGAGHGTEVPAGDAGGRGDAAGVGSGVDCFGTRAGNLYLQYWLYYPDSATLRGVPIAGARGYHPDDWESVQIRIGPDGRAYERASSHHGYNHAAGIANAGSDAGLVPLREAAETVGARPRNGWGPATRLLLVSGGSHAGNADGAFRRIDRLVPPAGVHLVPLEPVVEREGDAYRFAVTPPWRKRVWADPEASSTD